MGMPSAACVLQERIESLQGGHEGMSSEPRNESQTEKERGVRHVQSDLPGGWVTREWEGGGRKGRQQFSRVQ